LFRLDLRHINFRYTSLSGCNWYVANLSSCTLERTDHSGATLDVTQLFGVGMLCANLKKALLKKCDFDNPAGSDANMECINRCEAILEGSSILWVATETYNCDLRFAVLAGADLEVRTGSARRICTLLIWHLSAVVFVVLASNFWQRGRRLFSFNRRHFYCSYQFHLHHGGNKAACSRFGPRARLASSLSNERSAGRQSSARVKST
jgi:hypothetical protein